MYDNYVLYVNFQRGNKTNARQTIQYHPGQLLFSRERKKTAALGGIRTHDTLLSRLGIKYSSAFIGMFQDCYKHADVYIHTCAVLNKKCVFWSTWLMGTCTA